MRKASMKSVRNLVKKSLFVLPFIFATLVFQSRPSQAQLGNSLDCRFVSVIENAYLGNHLKFNVRDKAMQDRVIEQYIKRLDPVKIYLLESDVKQVNTLMDKVFDKTKAQDCAFLGEIQKLIVKRMEERLETVKKVLDNKYKLDNKAEFVYDPDHKPFPKTSDEAQEFLTKYLHFQVANYVATDVKLNEAKERVIKSYERMIKRQKERKLDDFLADYLDAFARSLDPHSSFFSRDFYEDFNINMSLSLEGIGATLSQQDGFTVVEALVPGGAAAKSSLIQPQDRIVAVSKKDGKMENVIDMDLKDVVKMIRGPKGTKVTLSILRKEGAGKGKHTVVLTREKINLEDEAASITYVDRDVNGKKKKIGIINFPSFYSDNKRGGRTSAADLKKLVAEARAAKADGLVLDLSNNGGGSLDDAVKIGGLFIKTGNIVKQSSRVEGREQSLADTEEEVDWAGPLVILVSRISASASEIVSGALKDYNRAVIVGGDHTFGKGSVQTVVQVPNDLGALKITVGMFFTPGGYSTQHRGVESDVVLPGPFSTDDVGEKSLDYSLPPKKIDPFLSKDAYVTEGEGAWMMIKPEWVKTLKEKSAARVAKNDDFKKIIDDLEKSKQRGKLIKVSEILNDSEKKEKDKKAKKNRMASKEEKNKEYLKRADIQEATNVMGDLIGVIEGKLN